MAASTSCKEPADDIQLSAIIVNYNSAKLLESCLSSLLTNKPLCNMEVNVVDNNSVDGSVQLLGKYPEVRLTVEKANRGFACAANHGYALSRGPYCLILNPDVIILPGSIQTLWEYMESSKDVGIAFPKLLNPDGSLQYSCRTFHTMWTILMRRTPLGKMFPESKILRDHLMMDWDHNGIQEVDWALGASMMVRKKAISGISYLMNVSFFILKKSIFAIR
jgi:GT2 family glycosyltransferase